MGWLLNIFAVAGLVLSAFGVFKLVEGWLARARARRLAVEEREALFARTKTCEFCLHWDHSVGQAALSDGSVFARVAAVRSPADMAEQFEPDPDVPGEFLRDEKGNRIPKPVSPIVRASRWLDLGACMLDDAGIFRMDTCSRFSRDIDATEGRKRRFLPVTQ